MSLESKMDRIIELLEKIEANTRWGGWVYPFPNWVTTSDNVEGFCCSCPPGDGSTCAGGTCCCREDYVCDKCRIAAGD